MNSEPQTTRLIKLEVDNFVFYRKSQTGLIVGKAVEPLISGGTTFLNAGENCKIKFNLDCPNFNLQRLSVARVVDFSVVNYCEEKYLRGAPVKQFTVASISQYHADNKREVIQF